MGDARAMILLGKSEETQQELISSWMENASTQEQREEIYNKYATNYHTTHWPEDIKDKLRKESHIYDIEEFIQKT